MAPQRPTLKTIAQLSGLAVPTVSRALNDAADIRAETKALVRKIADEIGYVPNRAGVRLRTGRTNVISLVLATQHDNHTARLISSIAQALEGTGYHLNVTPYTANGDIMKPIRYIVETGSADGIILNQIEPHDPRIAYLMDRKFPFAAHGRSLDAKNYAYYDFDNAAYGAGAVHVLAERDRTRIAAVVPPLRQTYSLMMVEAMDRAARDKGVLLTKIDGADSDAPVVQIVAAVQEHLQHNPDTDAIITASAGAALSAISAVERSGRVVGKDVDVFTKEALPFLRLVREDILAVSESISDAGSFLARAALQAVQSPEMPPMQFLETPDFG